MEYREIDQKIAIASQGKEAMAFMRKGWEIADANKDHHKQIKYRLDYVKQSVFHDDTMEMYVVFPEIIKLHDEWVRERGYDEMTRDIMWQYKWVVENATDFYQISIKQFDMFFEDAKKRFIENNYSLRPLYQKRALFYSLIDREEAIKSYKEFLRYKRDTLCDCLACERSGEVQFFLNLNESGKAAERAEPLFDGDMNCYEQPACTYGDFIRYYNEKIVEGDKDYIEPAGNLCEQLRMEIVKKGIAHEYIADVLMFYALTQPTKALNFYKKYWSHYEESRNPRDRFMFATAAVCFFNHFGDKKTYKMSVNSGFPFYNESNTYNVAQLKAYYEDTALDIAKKLDSRNGNTLYTDRYKKMTQTAK